MLANRGTPRLGIQVRQVNGERMLLEGEHWNGVALVNVDSRGEIMPHIQHVLSEHSRRHSHHFKNSSTNAETSVTIPLRNLFPFSAEARSGWPMTPLSDIS